VSEKLIGVHNEMDEAIPESQKETQLDQRSNSRDCPGFNGDCHNLFHP
jgi:hypothetical protein